MIDASALFIMVMIGSLFMWILLLFKIVLSPFKESTKWRLVGILFVFAVCYIVVPVVATTFGFEGYNIPAALVSALFLGLVIFNYMVNVNIKRYKSLKQQ